MFHINLGQRLINASQAQAVQECLTNGQNDVVLVAEDSQIVKAKRTVLENTSRYFQGTFRSDFQEAASNRIQTRIKFPILQAIVNFLETGSILVNLDNIKDIYMDAHYLQIDCLLDRCERYLIANLQEARETCFFLAFKYGERTALIENTAAFFSENWQAYTETLLNSPGEAFAAVIGHNKFRVRTEDEVVNFVFQWNERGQRPERELLLVLQQIRYPHLSTETFNNFMANFPLAVQAPHAKLALEGKFAEIPEQQLNRRLSYANHVHLIWRQAEPESEEPSEVDLQEITRSRWGAIRGLAFFMRSFCSCSTPQPPRRAELPPRNPRLQYRARTLGYKLTCLQFATNVVVSHEFVKNIAHAGPPKTKGTFLTVMNSLKRVTYAEEDSNLVVYREQDDGDWIAQARFHCAQRPWFIPYVHRGKLLVAVSWKTNSRRFLEVNGNRFDTIELNPPIVKDAIPKIMFWNMSDDIITTLEDFNKLRYYDRKTGRFTQVDFVTPHEHGGFRWVEAHLRADNQMYIIAKKLDELTRFECGLSGYVHRIDGNTKTIRATVQLPEVHFDDEWQKCSEFTYTLFLSGSKLFMATPVTELDGCRIDSWLDDRNIFSYTFALPEPNCTLQDIDYARLETSVPTHIHPCRHQTLLQKFCHTLHEAKDHELLSRLAKYL